MNDFQKNKVYFDEEAVDGLVKGLEVGYKAVAGTIGSAGRNAVYRRYGNPLITNDGVSIIEEIELEDGLQAMGLDLGKEAARRTNTEAGDGTTTATVLVRNIVQEGLKKIRLGVNPMKLRKQIDAAVKKITEEIKAKAISIKNDEELLHVANISVENPEIAKIVVEAVKRSGLDGLVLVEESSSMEIKKENIEGFRFDKGYVTPYMINDIEKMEAVLTDVPVLVTDKVLNMNSDIFKLLGALKTKGQENILIIADDVSGELLGSLVANRKEGKFYAVAVKKPHSREFLEDIAIMTGAEAFTEEKIIKQFTEEHVPKLGFAKKVVVGKDSCTIIGGRGDEKLIAERVAAIKTELKTAEHYAKDKLKERLAKMTTGVTIIKSGAPTEAEMKYLKLKIDDAVAATRAAMEEGIVPGGGRVLFDVSREKAETDGEAVVRAACSYPIRKIIENYGEDPVEVIHKLKDGEIFNSEDGSICSNPVEKGIIDPVKVTRCALKNAASLAGIFLTTHCVLVPVKKEPKKE